jgi:hypothetical protein
MTAAGTIGQPSPSISVLADDGTAVSPTEWSAQPFASGWWSEVAGLIGVNRISGMNARSR